MRLADDLQLNYLALWLAIVKGYSAEESFLWLEGKTPKPKGVNKRNKGRPVDEKTREQTREMYEARQSGASYPVLAKQYGISVGAIYNRIKRYEQSIKR